MSIVKIVQYGEEVLRKPTKEVTKFSNKTKKIIDDLLDTMYSANGVGLAAPQIGISQKIFVIDVSTGDQPLNPIVFVNPKIVKKEGGVMSYEGCLSFPEVYTHVKRYERVIVKAKDHKNRPFSMDVNEGTLLCRAIQHETDHLNGIVYVDHAMNRFETNRALHERGFMAIQEDYLLEEPELEEIIAKKVAEEGMPTEEDQTEDEQQAS